MSEKKERLDKLVTEKGLAESREKARVYILAGNILVNGERITKASRKVNVDSEIKVEFPNQGYVSRGGIKLEHALDIFNIKVSNTNCLDIGASTGGFTDCLLKRGATRVVALDVGKGLIDERLRKDQRVRVIEGFNARYIDRLDLEFIPDIVTIDVSFISLRLILPPLKKKITPITSVVALIKPQFELEKNFKGFKGVVKEKELHKKILTDLHLSFVENSYIVHGYTYSPIRGPKGNIEFFVHLTSSGGNEKKTNLNFIEEGFFEELVKNAYDNFYL